MIIDTHCHLDDEKYTEDFDAVLQRAQESRVERFIIPGADPSDLPRARELAVQYPQIFFAAGVHPYHIDEYDEALLEAYLQDPKCVAVGECGLDYYRLPEEAAEKAAVIARQKEVFAAQIDLACRYEKPLIVHIREASRDAGEILLRHASRLHGGVLHCYNADDQLLALAGHGFYYGIGGVLTFKNARKLVAVLPKIPKEKLLIETDAPYLTPHPHRGQRNEPAYTALVAQKMADLLEMEVQAIEDLTTRNAQKLFSGIVL